MTGLTLTVEHQDGSSSTLNILSPDAPGDSNTPSLQTARITRNLIRQPDETDGAEVVVHRDAWQDVEDNLDRTDDKLLIKDGGTVIFGGRLRDYQFNEVSVSVLIDGPKRDALDAEPSSGNTLYQPQDDTNILSSILSRVDTVSAGSTSTVDGSIAFAESQAAPGKSITKLAAAADAEVQYSATGSGFELDYVADLGGDRTGTTLKPANATVQGGVRMREQITEDVTHVRVLGAGEGKAQITASATASGYDPNTDREVYRQHTDKDIQQQTRAAALATTLVDEYDGSPEYLEIEFEIPTSVDPEIGDTFSVSLPAYNIDTTLRVIELDRLVDGDGDRYRAVLSNRRHTRRTAGEAKTKSVDEFREGNAGQYFFNSDGRELQPIEPDEPREITIPYPTNVISDFNATLRVVSNPYRGRAISTGHSHTVTVNTTSGGSSVEVGSTATISDSGVVSVSTNSNGTGSGTTPGVSVSNQPQGAIYVITGAIEPSDPSYSFADLSFSFRDANFNEFFGPLYDTGGGFSSALDTTATIRNGFGTQVSMQDMNGLDLAIDFTFNIQDSSGNLLTNTNVDIIYGWEIKRIDPHEHAIDQTITSSNASDLGAGVNTFTNETVSNVDVDLNGTTIKSKLASPIDEEIDITNQLSAGDNSVTVTTDSLGEIAVAWEFEGIKQSS